ncbi:MAG: beta-lactamase family protein [Gemmatimonadaceae bacterium]|nr:beta-lactamase family protein [Gemmatimonadaceae bacterium]
MLAQPTATKPGDDLLGLWGAEPIMGPQVRGELLLERRGHRWTARIGGFEVVGAQSGDSIVLALPGGQGTLRAWIRGAHLSAFWIQPEGQGPQYATPVRFEAAGAGMWLAKVDPLVESFPMYLMVTRDTSGVLRGRFRNPAANWPGRAGVYRIERDGDNLAFIVQRTGKLQWRQAYDSAQRRITFDFGNVFAITPRTAEQAVGFYPRSPGVPPYEYRAPIARADGWRTASARAVGVDDVALRSIVRSIAGADPLSDTLPRVHALLVVRHGALILEEYFNGYSADQLHDLRSASKTMTSVMDGVAMLRGATFTMDTKVRGSQITVGQLLTHSSGLACDDDNDDSPGNEDTMQSAHSKEDWYDFFMALPRVHPSGSTYAYCSAGINMVGSVIRDATHQWLPAFFDERIARPLQMTHYAINLMPNGEAYSAGGMQLLPRDLLKFGQLYLNGGTWNGTRIVSTAWARLSTSHQIDRQDGSDDGFGWHRHKLSVGSRSYQTYEAGGNGGQFVVVIPDLDLVVATTAGNYGQYDVWKRIRESLVPQIMGAVR